MSPAGRRMVQQGLNRSGVKVSLCWVEITGGTVNAVTGATVGGTREIKVLPDTRAHVTEVKADSGYRRFAGIEVGDVFFDLAATLDLSAYPGCWIEWNGRKYRQKRIADIVVAQLDHASSGGTALQTLLFGISE